MDEPRSLILKPHLERHAAWMRLQSTERLRAERLRAERFYVIKSQFSQGKITESEAKKMEADFWAEVHADQKLAKGYHPEAAFSLNGFDPDLQYSITEAADKNV